MNCDVLVLGFTRIGDAVEFYLTERGISVARSIGEDVSPIRCKVVLNCLPRCFGERGIKTAISCGASLVDVSDLDDADYVPYVEEVSRRGILVVPGFGLSPGLMNLYCGRLLDDKELGITDIDIEVGTFSSKPFYFPFLWCFEELVDEFRSSSLQLIEGQIRTMGPFASKRFEEHMDVQIESYLAPSGFERMFKGGTLRNLTFRTVRPRYFEEFFRYCDSYGLLEEARFQIAKEALEVRRFEDISIGRIRWSSSTRAGLDGTWEIKTSSTPDEALSSIQKLTGASASAMARAMLEGVVEEKGIVSPDALGRSVPITDYIVCAVRSSIGIKAFNDPISGNAGRSVVNL